MTKEQRKKLFEDAEVAHALFILGTEGFNFTEIKELKDASGKVLQIETTTKHVPPSVEAQIFWLVNRRPQNWKIGDEAMAQIFGKVEAQLDDYFRHRPH